MAYRNQLETLAKKDLIILYNISYPTLRRWLRRAGLQIFIGRKKLKAEELVTIFQHIGLPRLARTASQRLKDLFFQLKGILSDNIRYKEQFQKELPKVRQDLLPASPEEQDHPPILKQRTKASNRIPIWDALSRLRCIAIKLLGAKARRQQQYLKRNNIISPIKQRKSLSKRQKMAA